MYTFLYADRFFRIKCSQKGFNMFRALKIGSLAILTILSLLTGCSNGIKDDGEIDYRITKPTITAEYSNLDFKYRKFEEGPIKKGDNLSIHLSAGFIKDTPESRSFSERVMARGTSAEVAIIAKVCEQGTADCSDNFSDQSDKSGRVIYFTDSLKAKQMLNISYLPVYGPIKYQGNPIHIQIYMVELDINSPEQQQLFSTLSKLGSVAYPPSSQVLKTLETLGSTLIGSSEDNNNNDSIFRYTFTLMPSEKTTKNLVSYPVLSQGNYVFIKKPTITGYQEEAVWDQVKLQEQTGKLVVDCRTPNEKIVVEYINDDENIISKEFDVCDDKAINPGNYQRVISEVQKQAKTLQEKIKEYKKEQDKDKRTKLVKESNEIKNKIIQKLASLSHYKDYRDNTYLTLQIQSGFQEAPLNHQQSLAVLMQDLAQIQQKETNKQISALEKYTSDVGRESNYQELKNLLRKLNNSALNSDEKYYATNTFSEKLKQTFESYTTEDCGVQIEKEQCKKLVDSAQIEEVLMETRFLIRKAEQENKTNPIFTSGYDINNLLPHPTKDTKLDEIEKLIKILNLKAGG